MLIFLYGQDTYRSRRKLNEIINHYKEIHKSGLSLKCLDGEKLDYQDFKNETQSVSMFNEKKLVVVEKANSNQEFKQDFLKDSERFIKTKDIILFYEPGEVPKDEFSKYLEKNSKSQKFHFLDGQKLKNWLKKEIISYGAKIDEEALEELVDFVGNDLWQMENEIKKLVSYKKDKEKIEAQDIELLVKPKIETDIFKTIDAMSENKKSQALILLHKHLAKGDAALYLLSMINFQFRNLLEVKDLIEKNVPYYAIPKKTGLHPFIVKKSYQQAQKFSLGQLKKIYQKILEADLDIKTGRVEPATALDLLIAGI